MSTSVGGGAHAAYELVHVVTKKIPFMSWVTPVLVRLLPRTVTASNNCGSIICITPHGKVQDRWRHVTRSKHRCWEWWIYRYHSCVVTFFSVVLKSTAAQLLKAHSCQTLPLDPGHCVVRGHQEELLRARERERMHVLLA
jgi:hypothetical protein